MSDKKNKGGRPPKNSSDVRRCRIWASLTEHENAVLDLKVLHSSHTKSEYVRMVLSGMEITPKIDVPPINIETSKMVKSISVSLNQIAKGINRSIREVDDLNTRDPKKIILKILSIKKDVFSAQEILSDIFREIESFNNDYYGQNRAKREALALKNMRDAYSLRGQGEG